MRQTKVFRIYESEKSHIHEVDPEINGFDKNLNFSPMTAQKMLKALSDIGIGKAKVNKSEVRGERNS